MPAQRSDAQQNHERVVSAAVRAFHREGLSVPMARIAADAGVGVGTVYRHFPTREALLDELTRRSFELMLARIRHAEEVGETGVGALRIFLAAVISDRDEMLLPSTGGPPVRGARASGAQQELHGEIRRLLARGAEDATIRRDVDVSDVAWLGATLAQPGRAGRAWDAIALRLLDTYLAGLGVPGLRSGDG